MCFRIWMETLIRYSSSLQFCSLFFPIFWILQLCWNIGGKMGLPMSYQYLIIRIICFCNRSFKSNLVSNSNSNVISNFNFKFNSKFHNYALKPINYNTFNKSYFQIAIWKSFNFKIQLVLDQNWKWPMPVVFIILLTTLV